MNEALQKQVKPTNVLANLVIYVMLFAAAWYGFSWWTNHKVSSDAAEKYEIAQRNGDRSTACFQAGVAAASYLSAKDEEAYKKWRLVEAQACGR